MGLDAQLNIYIDNQLVDELYSWRSHYDLNLYMLQLANSKNVEYEIGEILILLSKNDIQEIIRILENEGLPTYFDCYKLGEYHFYEENILRDIKIFKQALKYATIGYKVSYYAEW